MNEWLDECEWDGEWMNGWMSIWVYELMNVSMNEWVNESVNGWMNEWLNGWVDLLQVSPACAVLRHWHPSWRWSSGGVLSHWQGHDRFLSQIRQLLFPWHRFLPELNVFVDLDLCSVAPFSVDLPICQRAAFYIIYSWCAQNCDQHGKNNAVR